LSASGQLTFLTGETTKTVTVDVNGDTLDEAVETFDVNVSNAVGATIADGTGIGTITEDDPPPALSIGGAPIAEGDGGTVDATFTVSLSSPSGRTVSVDYSTADGLATAPADYVPASSTLTFAAGETTKTVTVNVNGDTLDEANETFAVNLANASHATIVDAQGVGTITDDDPTPTLVITDTTVTEGDAPATVRAAGDRPGGLRQRYGHCSRRLLGADTDHAQLCRRRDDEAG
jgi:hypothetical protein